MTYSVDFRRKVLAIKEQENLTFEEAAARFGVGKASLVRWNARLEPCRTRHKPAAKLGDEALRRDVELYPDAFLYERAARLGASQQGVCAALKRLGVGRKKKTLSHPKADEEARRAFLARIEAHREAGRQAVFLDGSGFARDMPRRHGYAPVGERCAGRQDWHARGRTNVIGALAGTALLTASLFTGSVNADVFHAWATQDLLPKLPARCVVVMDNAAFHKRADIRQAIEDAGHVLEFLPAYSPDLNPIEHKWVQAKAARRRRGCSIEELFADGSL